MFSPIQLGPIEIPNRFYFGPHGNSLSFGNRPAQDFAYYSAARARGGGCGLVVNSLTVHDRGASFQPSPHPEENIASFRAMAEVVHGAGAKIFAELWYHWSSGGRWQPFGPIAPSMGASPALFEMNDLRWSAHEMDRTEIRSLVRAFGVSTAHLRLAGYDGVMLHAAHAAILEHFLSPYFNRRSDEYGGSLDNRMRFVVEALESAREGAAGEMAVGIRLNCDELLPGGYGTDYSRQILQRLCEAGLLDFVDLDIALEPQQFPLGMPTVFVEPQVYRPYVEAIRGAAGEVPVLSVLGRLTSVADGEEAIAAGVCDMVGATRALIAEPELVQNAFAGKEDESRKCIACNWCVNAVRTGAHGCAINPASYRERLWGVDTFRPASQPSHLVIVGGGPAGLEAARVGALRGHRVTMLEARPNLGGGLAVWATLPGREWFAEAISWWERQLQRLGVDVRLERQASADEVLDYQPDAVIVATGSYYNREGRSAFRDLEIPGHDRPFVYRPDDILLRGQRPSGRVVLLDSEGLHTGAGIAELLAASGADVEYVTSGFSPLSVGLINSLEYDQVITRLKTLGVRFAPATYIASIGERSVTLFDVHTRSERVAADVDAVVLVTGRLPADTVARDLAGRIDRLYTVGDALAVRSWASAVYEGHKFARDVGEPETFSSVGDAYFSTTNVEAQLLQPAEVLLAPSD